jgi:hypothetical protein
MARKPMSRYPDHCSECRVHLKTTLPNARRDAGGCNWRVMARMVVTPKLWETNWIMDFTRVAETKKRLGPPR